MKQPLLCLILLLFVSLPACKPSATNIDKGDVRIRWARDPDNLDPLIVDNTSAYELVNLLHCSLLYGSYQEQDFVPWLAEAMPSVQSLNDSLVLINYRIRPEATWDTGAPVLAQDVALTLKVMNCPGLPVETARATFGFIRNIRLDAQDPRRFTLECIGQSPDHMRISGDFSIFPEYVLDPKGSMRSIPLAQVQHYGSSSPEVKDLARRYRQLDLARHPERLPGCGPYHLKEWKNGRYLTVQRKAHWWADALPAAPPQLQAFPTQLTFQIIPDAATATLALRRGDIDLYAKMPAGEFARLQQSAADQARLQFFTVDSYEFLTAYFNVRHPSLHDALTRQALTHLFNIPALIQATQQGAAYASVGLISPRVKSYYNDSLPLPAFSTSQAAALLGQAGWQRLPNGRGWQRQQGSSVQHLNLAISYRTGEPSFETVSLQFRAAAAQLGIPVELRPTDPSLFGKQLRAGETVIALRNLVGNPFSYDFTALLHSKGLGAGNFTGYSSPITDRLIEDIAASNNRQKKTKLLRKFQRIMAQERPFTVLYFLKYRVAASRRLGQVPVTGLRVGYEAARIKPMATALTQ